MTTLATLLLKAKKAVAMFNLRAMYYQVGKYKDKKCGLYL